MTTKTNLLEVSRIFFTSDGMLIVPKKDIWEGYEVGKIYGYNYCKKEDATHYVYRGYVKAITDLKTQKKDIRFGKLIFEVDNALLMIDSSKDYFCADLYSRSLEKLPTCDFKSQFGKYVPIIDYLKLKEIVKFRNLNGRFVNYSSLKEIRAYGINFLSEVDSEKELFQFYSCKISENKELLMKFCKLVIYKETSDMRLFFINESEIPTKTI